MCAGLGQASAFADARCPTHSLLVAAAAVIGDGMLVVPGDFAIRKPDPKGSDGLSFLAAQLWLHCARERNGVGGYNPWQPSLPVSS